MNGQVLSGLWAIARNPPVAGIGLIALGLPVYWIWGSRSEVRDANDDENAMTSMQAQMA